MNDHTETVDLDYDPEQTNYQTLLSMFWKYHDPTSKCTRQYMSAIFFHDEEQKLLAEESMKAEQNKIARPIRTSILPAKAFYEAEDYHQKYLLQRHGLLMNSLDIDPGEDLIKSHVAARINGYIGGFGTVSQFDKEWQKWGINDKMAEYIRQEVMSSFRGSC
ncbi:peptide methionine sulfoxide reductase-like [Homarus americanus]|nr:peptide methionine sulfoxide reductase-like [Homarus americanus]XP_042209730.1 peptide methionine sulfoxide reductase-like [Homarus americanus]XP_042209731.1 peptide methionine sulfoxide reductase-like [Homarus americanus]XP_042209732.1 peptide methionine sulfoxide reductase-like [Homarus americanus]